MKSHLNHRPSQGGTFWFGAFLLFTALVAGIGASFLIRRGRSSALLIALVVAIAFLLLEWPRAAINTEDLPERDSSRKPWFAIALVAIATGAAYLPTLRMYFLADDFGDVQLYSHPSFRTFLRLFTMDQSQGIWGYLTQEFRPFVGLSYMMDYSLWGANPVGYHLTAVLLHVVSSLAIFAIGNKAAALTNWGAALAGLLFALLPVHPESVAWINGSKVDALPSMFYLVGFLGFVSYRATGHAPYIALAAAGFVSSLMSKEIAVTFPAMLVSFDLVRWASRTQKISPDSAASGPTSWRATLFPYLLIGGLFVAYLVARGAIFPTVLREDRFVFSLREAFASLAGFRAQIDRLWSELKSLHVYNLGQFLIELSPWSVGIVLGLPLAWTVFLVRTGARSGMLWVMFFGGAWYAIACLPLLVTYHSARHLYLPMAGPCIALAYLASSGWTLSSSRARVGRVAGSVALVSILAVSLWTQINSWVRAAEISNKLEEGFVAALEATPKETLTIAWAPYGISPSGWAPPWVWPWVMPFALQNPFVGHDLYSSSRLVEFPHMYCCPVEQWWERKRSVLLSVLSGEPEELVEMRRLAWEERNGVVSRLRIAVPRKQLRALVEGVLGEPVGDAKTVSYATAIKLMTAFMDLTAKRH